MEGDRENIGRFNQLTIYQVRVEEWRWGNHPVEGLPMG